MKYVDFIMIGWELDYSRNRVLLHKLKLKYKGIEIKKDQFFLRHIKILFKTLKAIFFYKSKVIYLPAFNQVNAPIIILLSKLTRKKIIVDMLVSEYDTVVHDRKLVSKKSLKAMRVYFFDYLCIKLSDIIICDTEMHKKYFISNFKADGKKIKVLPVGAEDIFTSVESCSNKTKNRNVTILFYGGYSPLHGIDKILEAASYLKDDPVTFTLIGDGQTKKEMVLLANKMNLNNVRFLDRVNYMELPSMIQKCDIGLGIFGDTEKANRVVPNKVYQLAACGKPIITLETDGIKEIFTDKQNILFVPKTNRIGEEMANKIRDLTKSANKREAIGLEAQRLMENDCHSGKISKVFYDSITTFYKK